MDKQREKKSDAEKLKQLAGIICNMEFQEIRMKTWAGRERYLVALERILGVIAYLQEDL